MPGEGPIAFSKVEAGEYSDVRYLAYWDVAPSGAPLMAAPSLSANEESSLRSGITTEQVQAVLESLRRAKSRGVPAGGGRSMRVLPLPH